MFAEHHGIGVLELDALFSARGLGGRPKRKAKQRSMQDFVCETEMETNAESDLTNEAHFRSKYYMAVDIILADFRGSFSDTSCAIIGAMKTITTAALKLRIWLWPRRAKSQLQPRSATRRRCGNVLGESWKRFPSG